MRTLYPTTPPKPKTSIINIDMYRLPIFNLCSKI